MIEMDQHTFLKYVNTLKNPYLMPTLTLYSNMNKNYTDDTNVTTNIYSFMCHSHFSDTSFQKLVAV